MKPSYEELKNRVSELEIEAEKSLRRSNDCKTREYLEGEKIIDIDKASGSGD
jgi:hypothetical protein